MVPETQKTWDWDKGPQRAPYFMSAARGDFRTAFERAIRRGEMGAAGAIYRNHSEASPLSSMLRGVAYKLAADGEFDSLLTFLSDYREQIGEPDIENVFTVLFSRPLAEHDFDTAYRYLMRLPQIYTRKFAIQVASTAYQAGMVQFALEMIRTYHLEELHAMLFLDEIDTVQRVQREQDEHYRDAFRV